ncbi:FAD dependent oxidoreductase [Mycena albidolilacea]|uniref:FAD dependent oxidoreductase n=1 Tax=Mycena albidolilacea TaxID=1033008 RepID=A0AAD6ZHH6_9AGAR|nr:FAD dependent oxidoreductase [Mycena albidolilacea]
MDKSPGYPRPNPCLSFWLQGARSSPLLGHRTTEALPEAADVVIIGSGLSGAAIAYFLLTGPNPPARVALLEAREACDGATARNGGHCRPDCYRDYKRYKSAFGQEQALKVIQNEKDTLKLVTEVIEKENIDCDFWRGDSYDVPMTQSVEDELAAAYQEFVDDGGPVDGFVERILDPEEARKLTRCPSARAVYKSSAATLWPHKLVLHLLRLCIEKHRLNLQTHTPVREVLQKTGGWIVKTDRGDVATAQVVYATNAFTATLLPEFLGRIWPMKGQCSVVIPTKSYSGLNNMLTASYNLTENEYLMQRPKDGVIIYGGGRRFMPIEKLRGNTDDSAPYPEVIKGLKAELPLYFEGWGDEALGEGMMHAWSGIMGYTVEAVPFVGELHNKPGAFICAGHHGHGMARIMTCAKGLAAVIQGGQWESTGLPECFQPSPERMSAPAAAPAGGWLNSIAKWAWRSGA